MSNRRRARPVLLAPLLAPLLLAALACGRNEGPTAPPKEEGNAGAAATPRSATLDFEDVSRQSGVDLENVSGDPVAKLALPENLGSGAAVLDYDRDGDFDLFVANGDVFPGQTPRAAPRCALYRNDGDFHFTDVSVAAGVALRAWCHGAWAVDFDADGFTDLYLSCYRRSNVFYRNRGDGSFEDVSAAWGGADPGPSTASVFFDADGDGDLDLYVGNYVRYDPENPPNGGHPCEWKGLKVSCGPLGTPPGADAFYENRDGALVLATAEFGFEAPPSYALGSVAVDIDRDGDTDVYVANDSRPNYFFENTGPRRFRERAMELGVAMNEAGRAQAGMGVDTGDLDGDGKIDLFVTNFSHDTNTFYRQESTADGKMLFSDATAVTKLAGPSFAFLSWGTRILDLDRDGWQDLVVVSGHVYPQVDGANVGTSYAQRNQIFRNRGPVGAGGDLAFDEWMPPAGDAFAKIAVSRGLVAADFDDDGDHDFVVVELDAKPTVIRNRTTGVGHWFGVLLVGAGKNREAIGATVEIEDSRGRVQVRPRAFGAGFFSTSDPRLHAGLGDAAGPVRRVGVTWPSGRRETWKDLAADRYWVIVEGDPEARPWPPKQGR